MKNVLRHSIEEIETVDDLLKCLLYLLPIFCVTFCHRLLVEYVFHLQSVILLCGLLFVTIELAVDLSGLHDWRNYACLSFHQTFEL